LLCQAPEAQARSSQKAPLDPAPQQFLGTAYEQPSVCLTIPSSFVCVPHLPMSASVCVL
jgi:hypothetical protein